MDQKTLALAQKIWDYHHLNHALKKADCILVLGSRDVRVANYAADLFLQGHAPYIIFSGGFGRITKDLFKKSEAETFADLAIKQGIPKDKILIENKSTNTGNNIDFTKKLLDEKGFDFKSFLVVQKPYMERRSYASLAKRWPDKEIIVTSPPIPFKDYPNEIVLREDLINAMVGDIQRIKEYPAKGYQIEQEIPADVWSAYEELVHLGYDKRLI